MKISENKLPHEIYIRNIYTFYRNMSSIKCINILDFD